MTFIIIMLRSLNGCPKGFRELNGLDEIINICIHLFGKFL
jgi:hypothetical protein